MKQTQRQSQQEQEQPPQRKGPPAGWRYYAQAKHRSRLRGWLAQVWRGAKNNAALVSLFGVLLTLLVTTVLAQQEQVRQQEGEIARVVQQQQVENQRAEAARELAEQRTQDEALQTYLDQMSNLLLEKDLRNSEEGSEVRTLARARTLTVLEALDPSRKTAVMQFLVESGLVQEWHRTLEPIISLAGADLRDANLRDANLRETDLSDADLSDANLERANLDSADLSDADLSGADLRGAYLAWSFLRETDLKGANLQGANLSGNVDLSGADLSDAIIRGANLRGANLRGARGVTEEQLEEQAKTLENATMPDGSEHH